MPRRTPITDRDYLKRIPLPIWGSSYTVIPHDTVIVNVLSQLKSKGFTVHEERYRCNNSGEVAVGVYHLNYMNDPDLGMMFAWANSYDKSMRFKCAVGGFVKINQASIIGDDFSWSRKHTGTADQEMVGQITNQVVNAQTYYNNLLEVKQIMIDYTVDKSDIAKFLGTAFFERNLFTKEQIGIVRDQMQDSSYEYNFPIDSLWVYYNHMLVALKRAHPRNWMEDQLLLHKFICEHFCINTPNTVAAPIEESKSLVTNELVQDVNDLNTISNEVTDSGSNLEFDNTIPFLEDVTEEEQKLINERLAAMGINNDDTDLNLP